MEAMVGREVAAAKAAWRKCLHRAERHWFSKHNELSIIFKIVIKNLLKQWSNLNLTIQSFDLIFKLDLLLKKFNI